MGTKVKDLEGCSDEVLEGGPEDTLKIKVDPWTGRVIADPDRTSRARVNPWTGVVIEVLSDPSEERSSAALPPLPPLPHLPHEVVQHGTTQLPPLGVVATIAVTAGAALGSLVTLLVV